ncbi:MAG: AroM family protein [Candidatus Rokubacteria bacterium]|nr:AroM family protein [Candidatus Rokubacteria bacterium]MBI3826999.1 AroM family protein [Candidatus Rokubacteria bacterium]
MSVRIGMITVGQSPRVDVVPDMREILGPAVAIVERGALDGLDGATIASLAPRPGQEMLVTRLAGGGSVFVAKDHVVARVQACVDALEGAGVEVNVLLCTGAFPPFRASRPLVEPQQVLLGVLRGLVCPGRLGVLTPSVPHVPQTEARWRADGFDPLVIPLSPYEESDPAAVSRAADALHAGGAGVVVMDCIGFRRKTRAELQHRLGVPVLVANLLVARVVAEIAGL